ncbi:hypothetical protein TNCT_91051 [Trichonephila clavata]|uniref:Uncharacterized protein n=1 Tax=Trichonephila clavata TaxID=2740835 RepID=A0A8X6HET6_TRICU|nr:hypothetical protein TNCT_91051 [Trichonephila clavata]
MESVFLLMRSWVFCPTPPEESFPVLRVCGGGRWSATHLPRMFQTYSTGFMYDECTGGTFHEKEIIHQISMLLANDIH